MKVKDSKDFLKKIKKVIDEHGKIKAQAVYEKKDINPLEIQLSPFLYTLLIDELPKTWLFMRTEESRKHFLLGFTSTLYIEHDGLEGLEFKV